MWQFLSNTIKDPQWYSVQEDDPPQRTGHNDGAYGFLVRTTNIFSDCK